MGGKIDDLIIFPDVRESESDNLILIGGEASAENLIEAYESGIFPWPFEENLPITWCSPDPRGILKLSDFRVPKTFKKFLKNKNNFQITYNKCFEEVIELCGITRKDTWITEDIISGYTELHRESKAYSVEAWLEGRLVGGLYGVCLGDFLSAESMFFLESNASKLCLYSIAKKAEELNYEYIDIQMLTPITESFGGKEISRDDFLDLLELQDLTKKLSLESF